MIIAKPMTYTNYCVKSSICGTFEGFTLTNGLKNAQNVKLGYWVKMYILMSCGSVSKLLSLWKCVSKIKLVKNVIFELAHSQYFLNDRIY